MSPCFLKPPILYHMCGIGGIIRFDGHAPDPARTRGVRERLRHRGPDGEGLWAGEHVALVHTRLAIIDLHTGRQPMVTPRTDNFSELVVVFNGEIYNHRELRAQLESLGHHFTTDHSDTEVLPHGYRQWGIDLPRRLEGMFAFAIHDTGTGSTFVTRDRIGKKPLYLLREPGQVIFASELNALLAGALRPPATDTEALRHFLMLGYTGRRALFAGVEELAPAHSTTIDLHGVATTNRYWQPPDVSLTATSQGVDQAVADALEQAVIRRLESDVPLGCFLSGGIDSSVIAAIAQRHLAKSGGKLRTFTVRLQHGLYDESGPANAIAQHLGTDHTTLDAGPDGDLFSEVEHLIKTCGEPTADSSILPTHWISRAARRHVKAVLSGDGGDELFGGYDRYRAMGLLARWGWLLRRMPLVAQGSDPRSRRTRLRRLLAAARPTDPGAQYATMVRLCDPDQLHDLAPDLPDAPHLIPLPDWPAEPSPEVARGKNPPDPRHLAMRWDLHHYLTMDILRKVDRAAMAVALEVRCPMLDTGVVELACHLPPEVLMPGARPKALLRGLASQWLPPAIANLPKRGFSIPIGTWFQSNLHQGLTERLTDGSLQSLGLSGAAVSRWLNEHRLGRADHTHRLFALLTLANWQRWRESPGTALPGR